MTDSRPNVHFPVDKQLLQDAADALLMYEDGLRSLARSQTAEFAARAEQSLDHAERVFEELRSHQGQRDADRLLSRFDIVKTAHSVRPALSDYTSQPTAVTPNATGIDGHSII